MIKINIEEMQYVNGGFLEAVGAFVAVFTLPHVIKNTGDEYSQWGQNISQAYWDKTYPYDPNDNSCYGPTC